MDTNYKVVRQRTTQVKYEYLNNLFKYSNIVFVFCYFSLWRSFIVCDWSFYWCLVIRDSQGWSPSSSSLFSASDSGYERTWQQVKVKHKNIVQTGKNSSWSSRQLSLELLWSFLYPLLPPSAAKRRRAEVLRTDGGSATPSLVSAEDDALQYRDGRLKVDVLPGAACLEPLVGPDTPFINGMSHRPLIGPCRVPTVREKPRNLWNFLTSTAHFIDQQKHVCCWWKTGEQSCFW